MEEMEWRIQGRTSLPSHERVHKRGEVINSCQIFWYFGILVFWYSGIFISVSLTSISVNIQYWKYFQVFSLEWEYLEKIYHSMFLLPYHFP